jgi:hypothetical protein
LTTYKNFKLKKKEHRRMIKIKGVDAVADPEIFVGGG